MQRNESMPVYATLDLTYKAMLLDFERNSQASGLK